MKHKQKQRLTLGIQYMRHKCLDGIRTPHDRWCFSDLLAQKYCTTKSSDSGCVCNYRSHLIVSLRFFHAKSKAWMPILYRSKPCRAGLGQHQSGAPQQNSAAVHARWISPDVRRKTGSCSCDRFFVQVRVQICVPICVQICDDGRSTWTFLKLWSIFIKRQFIRLVSPCSK